MPATVATPATAELPSPEAIHNCPNCSHWLSDGTLVCPDCQTITYGQHLSQLATSAQQLERQQKWVEARDMWKRALEWLPAETRQAVSIQQHVAQLDQRLAAEEARKAQWTKRLGPFAPIVLFLAKIKSFVFILFKAKFLFSLLAYFSIYWALFGWRFAVGLTVTIFIHEMGHYIAAKRRGMPVDLPMFLPGFGAYVRWYNAGATREDLGMIALAGPLAGMVGALIAYGVYLGTHSGFFQMMAYLGAWINLINLFAFMLPFLALDGAQAAYALSRMQRMLVAATFLVFFGLTVNAANGDLSSPIVHWSFLILGLAMGWRSLGTDVPQIPSTKAFVAYQMLVVVLGVLLLRTQVHGM